MQHTDIDPALGLMAEFGKVTKGTVRHINQMRQDASFADGAVPARYKALAATLWAISARCEPCFKFYVQQAVRLGADEAELGEFLAVASTMGGCVGEMWALKALARFPARRSRPSVQVRRVALPAVADSHHMANNIIQSSHDWLRSPHTSLLAWWIPCIAVLAGLLAPVPVRTAIWIIALSWMGTACILNAKRCGRTHCRYTGPYYLAMSAPVGVLGSGFFSSGIYAWLVLAGVILLGSKLLWWATERAWGKYS